MDSSSGEHRPYVPDEARIPEFNWGAVLVGSLLGIVFGASSLYLVLKVGMTVSASIPVAVLSITLFRVGSRIFGLRPATILENNIVQTAGSAGESIAFGVGATMPALMILGFEMDIGRVMVVAVLGGLLGILMMIPLRRAFIVHQHDKLKYPEGTACADVLIVGQEGGSTAQTVFTGFFLALGYRFLMEGLRLWKEVPTRPLSWFKGATLAVEADPALLGVGYIIGTRTSCIMAGGGVLAWLVLAPAIHFFGDSLQEPLRPGKILISAMSDGDLRDNYMLYIGAGAVAAGGAFALAQALPLILGSLRSAFRELPIGRRRSGLATIRPTVTRTDRDMPSWLVGVGGLALILAIWATDPLHRYVSPWIPDLQMNLLGATLIVLFGFLFVTVSSRLTGEIGSSSNPISGMTVATLLLTCLIFYALHWTRTEDQLAALSVAAVVCVAASNGGTTSQDLKTGYLVGATPLWQQWAIIVGTLTSALVIGLILIVLNRAGTVFSTRDLPVPKTAVDVSQLTETERAPGDATLYHVWRPTDGNAAGVAAGKYLVDDSGHIHYLVDPGINGKLTRRDDGSEVQKFEAPKAYLMAIIAQGILSPKPTLPWVLVLLGVFLAIVLELCGASSLPFAVGVYLPLSTSLAVFAGGAVRWVVDRWGRDTVDSGLSAVEAKVKADDKTWPAKDAEVEQATKSEMSPGVLFSTGYIAGATIAGVLVAFLSFSDTVPRYLARWEYREVAVANVGTADGQIRALALSELGLDQSSAATRNDTSKIAAARIDHMADEIRDLNRGVLAEQIPVKAGTELRLPGDKNFTVKTEMPLGQVAQEQLGSANQAGQLLDMNSKTLPKLERLAPRTLLKVPQRTWPAVTAFSVMTLVLLAVGMGWIKRGAKQNADL